MLPCTRILAILAALCLLSFNRGVLAHVMFTTMGTNNTFSTANPIVVGRRVAQPEAIVAAKCIFTQNGAVVRYHVALGPTSGTLPIPIRVQIRGGNPSTNTVGGVLEEFTTTVRLTQATVLSFDSTVNPIRFTGDCNWVVVSIDGSLVATVNWNLSPTGVTGVLESQNTDGSFSVTGTALPMPAITIEGESVNGACCNPQTGQCNLLLRSECRIWNGFLYDPTVSCAVNPCTISGACCSGAACSILTPAQCVSGTFQGGGTSCSPLGGVNRCCKADFNASGSLSVQDIFDYLNAWFAACQ